MRAGYGAGKAEFMQMEIVNMAPMASMDMGYMGGSYTGMGDMMSGTEQPVSKTDKLMSSWFFVGGVTTGVLALGVLAGLLCAKLKIKKGIDLYED